VHIFSNRKLVVTGRNRVFGRLLQKDNAMAKAFNTISYREQLPGVVRQVVASCSDKTCFEHVDATPMPSKTKAIEILSYCQGILFPGYFKTKGIDWVSLQYRLGQEISNLYDLLAHEITMSIRHECLRQGQSCQHCEELGQKNAYEFIQVLPTLRAKLATDVKAAFDGDPAAASYDEIIFSYPGTYAVLAHRVAHRLYELQVPILPRIISEHAHSVTGIDIHPGASIGESFFIDHGTGVVIGQTAIIGNRVKLYQGVTLGALSLKRDKTGSLDRTSKRHPTLEDDVTVYAGSTILGGETTIGARSIVGGNVWLTKSIPADTKVILTPPELQVLSTI